MGPIQSINRAECSVKDELAEEVRKFNKSQLDEYIASESVDEDIPQRWTELNNVDRMVLVGIAIMLIAIWGVAIVFAARSIF